MKTETFDTISAVGSKTTIAGAGLSGISLWVTSNLLGIAGVLIALLGVWVNVHYKRKADKRRELEFQHNMRMKENADRRLEEWQAFRMQAAREGMLVPPITDFGPLAHAAGPWAEKNKPEEDEDGG